MLKVDQTLLLVASGISVQFILTLGLERFRYAWYLMRSACIDVDNNFQFSNTKEDKSIR